MKQLIFSVIIFMFSIGLCAQTPQIAVVRPDGTTFICPTFDSAYNKAVTGDNIFLPGGSFSLSNSITKSINIYGAGSDEDSSFYTAPTIISNLTVAENSNNGSIEGVKILSFTFNSTSIITNYSIKKCFLSGGIGLLNGTTIQSTTVNNCYIGSSSTGGSGFFSFYQLGTSLCFINNSMFSNNRIMSYVQVGGNANEFDHNLFFFAQQFAWVSLFSGSVYKNNIFQYGMNSASSNSIFYNNINGYPIGNNNTIFNNASETPDLTFINPGTPSSYGWISYDKHNDYHLKPTSLGKNSGTDGTDIGDYGGTFPWSEGIIPSNPHIYYKLIAPQTGPDGKLQIRVKVRTSN